ncbi:MAG: J domain-containing protein [Christensenellaceae bacterium]|nr:J domain-containing protein [Christensenellaceae bacterium]
MPKQYANASFYEEKLKNVMQRMDANSYDYNFDRHGAWVQFMLKGQLYRFDHTKQKAEARGIKLSYGSDCFAQIVLSLEDLARMAERGIYELQTWLSGMRFLPPAAKVPECLSALGFVEIPGDVEEVKARFRNLAKKCHPDNGGNEAAFIALQEAAKNAMDYVSVRGKKHE